MEIKQIRSRGTSTVPNWTRYARETGGGGAMAPFCGLRLRKAMDDQRYSIFRKNEIQMQLKFNHIGFSSIDAGSELKKF
eukprot:scaffold4562_cov255-Pinguiococcus_pyrenoidosus.AAC.14